jgi:hypothetical protein
MDEDVFPRPYGIPKNPMVALIENEGPMVEFDQDTGRIVVHYKEGRDESDPFVQLAKGMNEALQGNPEMFEEALRKLEQDISDEQEAQLRKAIFGMSQ